MPGLARINIEQQMAAIGIESTPARMKISQPRLTMKVKTELPKMEIENVKPEFDINREKINDESGLKSPKTLSKEYRNDGREGAISAIGRIASEGNYLGNLKRRGNRVAQLSRSKTLQAARKPINIGLMPKSSPEITWNPGHMKLNWSRHNFSIDWEGDYMPQFTLDPPYSVEVFLRNKPYFRVTVTEGEDLYRPGRRVDKLM